MRSTEKARMKHTTSQWFLLHRSSNDAGAQNISKCALYCYLLRFCCLVLLFCCSSSSLAIRSSRLVSCSALYRFLWKVGGCFLAADDDSCEEEDRLFPKMILGEEDDLVDDVFLPLLFLAKAEIGVVFREADAMALSKAKILSTVACNAASSWTRLPTSSRC